MSTAPAPPANPDPGLAVGQRYRTDRDDEVQVLAVDERQVTILNCEGREIVHDRPVFEALVRQFLTPVEPQS